MSVSLHKTWTQEAFFAWAEAQEERFEFDGVQPVAVGGDTVACAVILQNFYQAVDRRLPDRGPCVCSGRNWRL